MDNKKFEQLIDLIINEDEDKARALFHDIVVEKSREIYESMMDEDMGMSGGMQHRDQVGGLQQEIGAEEEGMVEDDDEFADIDMDDGEGDMDVDLDSDDMGDGEMGEEDLEDRVVDLEDKLDQLMAEFEELMGDEGGMGDEAGEEFGGDEDMGDEMMEGSEDDEEEVTEGAEDDEEEVTEAEEDDEEESLEESVQLQKVKSVTHGDNGQNTKSPVAGKNPIGARPANKLGGHESTTGGTQGGLLKPTPTTIPGKYKNAPGATFSEKGESAPKPKHGDDGQNTKSITSESKKSVKKPITKPASKPVAQTTKKIVKK